jgi:hypothetical protein
MNNTTGEKRAPVEIHKGRKRSVVLVPDGTEWIRDFRAMIYYAVSDSAT